MSNPADELFVLPPQDFVAARDALAKRLRAEGRRPEAKEVKGLRRPPVSAWALNQLARQEPDEVAALITAGEELPAAQQALLAGDAERFREAVKRHRELLGTLTAAGADLVVERNVSSSDHRQDIGDDLRAASTIPAAREPFRAGRLTERPGALGEPDTGLLAPALAGDTAPGRPGAGRADSDGAGADGPGAGAADAEAERRAQARRAHAAHRQRLVERLAQARRQGEEAEATRDRVASEVARLEVELEQARQAQAAAEADLTAARDSVADLQADLARADADAPAL